MPRIFRIQGPGEHSLAGAVLTFDADGIAESEDADVLATVDQFPQMFLVLGAEDPVPGTPPEPWDDPDAPPVDNPDGGVGEEGEGEEDALVIDNTLPPEGATQESLELMTVIELRELANTYTIPRIAGMNKAELIAAILVAQG